MVCRLAYFGDNVLHKLFEAKQIRKLKSGVYTSLFTKNSVKFRLVPAICVLLIVLVTSTMEFEKFLTLGKTLGLEGKDLVDFAQNRELKAEKKREKEEAIKRELIGREEKRTNEEAERNERAKERAHAKEMKEFELKFEQTKGSTVEKSKSDHQDTRIKKPKLPSFSDGRDDMDAYLRRFERFATIAKWPKSEWALALSSLLTGKALEVYSRLPVEKASDYQDLKSALLHRYELTEEGFRVKFRNSQRDTGETFSQFAARLTSYLNRWAELGEVTKTYDGLSDLLLREQIIAICGKDLAMYLKERKPSTVQNMALLADRYVEAHRRLEGEKTSRRFTSDNARVKPLEQNAKPGASRVEYNRRTPDTRTCFVCGGRGHIARNCRHNFQCKNRTSRPQASCVEIEADEVARPEEASQDQIQEVAACIGQKSLLCDCAGKIGENVELSCGHSIPMISAACTMGNHMPVRGGLIGNKRVSVLRDSGCSTVVVRRELVEDNQFLMTKQKCLLLDRTVRSLPVARIAIDSPYFVGTVDALCMTNTLYDLVIGNIIGAREPKDPDPNWTPQIIPEHISDVSHGLPIQTAAVETRAQKIKNAKSLRPLKVPQAESFTETRKDIQKAQSEDPTLDKLWKHTKDSHTRITGRENETKYIISDGLLFREFQSPSVEHGRVFNQLVVPQNLRSKVLKLAHDSTMSGHLGIKKTADRVLANFYWPGCQGDIHRYCVSCDICQRTVPKGSVRKVPLGRMPLIDTPFRRVAVDLVGPIQPVTDRGNRYILTLVDYATRYPEAVALPRIETERVAEALFEIFSRMGVPHEILSDMGSQFTAELMQEVGRLMSLKQLHTTPYHPICNGLVEKFNGTLKRMLRRMCNERPRDWDRYIPALLFAYRESPQESLGYSPFQLIFGHTVRGPLTILKELWTGNAPEEIKTTYQYVVDLQERLETTCKFAREELAKSSIRYKKYYDTRTKDRTFRVGDRALVLLPTDNNKLLMQWKGPFEVVRKVAQHDYCLDMPDKQRTFHANLLKKYIAREEPEIIHAAASFRHITSSVIDDDVEEGMIEVKLLPIEQTEKFTDVSVCENRTEQQKQQINSLLHKYSDVLTDVPGRTELMQHSVKLTTNDAIYSKAYPVPFATQETVRKEIDSMLKLGVIERSDSKYASPIVLVKKKDGSIRFCVDFRKLNRVTIFDPEPIPNADTLMAQVATARYFTKLDLTKGYWQIPITDSDKEKTAFITSEGLYQFTVLPFGMVNAPATFTRMMRKLLEKQSNVISYIDDILIFTDTWEEHMRTTNQVLERLRNAQLTAKPSKCIVAYDSLEFLGHVVGNGQLKPQPEKITKIMNASRPRSKKEVRSFMGLVNYYRKFIPNFAAIAVPITDLTKKGNPNIVKWEDPQEHAFSTLKERLSASPILRLPDHQKGYILRTDASDIGIGTVLMQQDGDTLFPICYASRKLLQRERAYAVIERECLALVWAVSKFHIYLYGREFLLETDHHPLAYLTTAKINNSRVMRWALSLQQYRFTVKAIRGSDNIGADFLSRCPVDQK